MTKPVYLEMIRMLNYHNIYIDNGLEYGESNKFYYFRESYTGAFPEIIRELTPAEVEIYKAAIENEDEY